MPLGDCYITELALRNSALGISPLEAIFSREPIIVDNFGGNAEIVKNKKRCFVLLKKDVILLAEKIKALVNDNQMGIAEYESVKVEFTPKNIVNKYTAVYYKGLETKE